MKIIIVSDETINVDKGGLSQTLYNVFNFQDSNNILCVTSANSYKTNIPSPPFEQRTITYNFNLVPVPRNRLNKYLAPLIRWVNYSYNNLFKSFKKIKKAIISFNTDVVIVCPNSAECLLVYSKIQNTFRNKQVIPYFMDDWMCQLHQHWIGGSSETLTKAILRKCNSWFVISDNLAAILSERYKTIPKRLLVVHNPVNTYNLIRVKSTQIDKNCTIAYSGSLWPMHFDALLLMAKAIAILKQQLDIILIIYSQESHWNWRKNDLIPLGVVYGGFIPYTKIHATLGEANMLLVTSSFLQQWYTHTKGSLQTKITDYLAAQRLIISCGPSYSTNNAFLKKYHCGICIETQDVDCIAKNLLQVVQNFSDYEVLPRTGYEVLLSQYSFEAVHEKVKSFLQQNLRL